jgi:hypothetical protein
VSAGDEDEPRVRARGEVVDIRAPKAESGGQRRGSGGQASPPPATYEEAPKRRGSQGGVPTPNVEYGGTADSNLKCVYLVYMGLSLEV